MKPRWKQLYEGAYSLSLRGCAGKVRIFLLVGDTRAMLIDSGYGLLDLQPMIRQITEKPVFLVNTHGHLDHANGSYQFEEAYLRSEDMETHSQHADPNFIRRSYARQLRRGGINAQHIREWLVEMERLPVRQLKVLDNVRQMDLGKRVISILHTPGHSKGSVCLVDEAYHAIYTGDNLGLSVWLSLPESVSVMEYRAMLVQLLKTVKEKNILWNYSSHMSRTMRAENDILRFIACCDSILIEHKKPHYHDFGVTSGNFIGKHGRYLLYQSEK